jgi:mannosyltransferase
MTSKIYILPIILVILLGGFLRTYDLGKESLTLDESQSVWQASHSVEFIKNYSAQNVHLPLHNLILHYWMSVFGSSEISIRVVSVIFGMLTLPVMYFLSYEITKSRQTALLTLTISAISPFWVWYSREIRMYTMLALFTSLSYLTFLRVLRTGKRTTIFAYILVNIIGVFTHYFFNLAILVQGIFLAGKVLKNWSGEFNKFYKRLALVFILSWISIYSVFSSWLYFLIQTNQGGQLSPALTQPTKFNMVLSLFNFALGYQPAFLSTLLIAVWPLLALYGFVFLAKRKVYQHQIPNIYLLFAGTFIPVILVYFISVYYKPIYLTRYLMGATPMFIVLMSWFLMETQGMFGRNLRMAVLLILLMANYNQFVRYDIPEKENYRAAVAFVEENASYRDVLVASPPYTLFPVHYYSSQPVRVSTLPLWDKSQLNIPSATPEIIKSDVEIVKDGHSRIFLVLTSNLGDGKAVQNYMDYNYTRLDRRKFSENVWVLTYQAEYPEDKNIANASLITEFKDSTGQSYESNEDTPNKNNSGPNSSANNKDPTFTSAPAESIQRN